LSALNFESITWQFLYAIFFPAIQRVGSSFMILDLFSNNRWLAISSQLFNEENTDKAMVGGVAVKNAEAKF
jgi:hypothetical protein